MKMKCGKCGSVRMTKFIDGFGQRRIFCKGCYGSFVDNGTFLNLNGQKILGDFNSDVYYNPRAVIRHFG